MREAVTVIIQMLGWSFSDNHNFGFKIFSQDLGALSLSLPWRGAKRISIFNPYVSVKKIARQIESPYYFFVVTLGNGFVLSMKRNGERSFAAVYIRMIDFRMFPPVSDFKPTVVISNLLDEFMIGINLGAGHKLYLEAVPERPMDK
ncbi:MAG: hypothetical protein OXH71_03005 [Candidatus Dadabacteria bacterium]|nr:hypothetical protein [Candidatus Dadabacteria bacterium]